MPDLLNELFMIGRLKSVPDWSVLAKTAHFRSLSLSQICHVTPRHLQRYFAQEMGDSPQEWLDERRLQEAVGLLQKGKQVKEVAFELGFLHSSHFIRKFKQRYGSTPLNYLSSERQLHQ